MLPEFVDDDALQAMRDHAVAEYPKESCGLLVGGVYRPYKNIAKDPINSFRIAPQAWVAASKAGGAQAVIHSHPRKPETTHLGPNHAPHPSRKDMEGQIASGVPWAIVPTDGDGAGVPIWWGDFRLDEPLIGAHYIHGVADCYSVVRRWFWQERGLKIPDEPRDYDWWSDGIRLYEESMAPHGWRQIEEREVQPGDACLMQVCSPVLNHIALYIGNDLILQHFDKRLSRREPLFPWRKHIGMWIRHHSMESCT